MRPIDYAICLISAIVMIIGGYQFYFFVQRHHLGQPREFNTWFDDKVPFWPSWVWIYSGLYYPIILLLVFAQESFQSFNYTAFSYLVLLAMQFTVFFFWPVRIPQRWRKYDAKASLSLRMLAFVHRYDKMANSIPSMHVSVATLTAIHLRAAFAPGLASWADIVYLFPLLIALSALFTKQHYVYDIVPGVVFGWAAARLTGAILN
ncbi:MAG: phosphatase PAP2 family protein [Alphaproteobacteria bacterium]|nr:phosphatase PAP2 family protein [Alphaproteobacteria bacterium]